MAMSYVLWHRRSHNQGVITAEVDNTFKMCVSLFRGSGNDMRSTFPEILDWSSTQSLVSGQVSAFSGLDSHMQAPP